ncbi:MAG: hypothetical protein GWN67_20080 [Phycisphaerae bacterium]|nr:hypothetical protein [Phycisphaerae bacterium]NIP54414.1 hypothetical protein [Phycisphaerae bacterium]NIS53273.1 hypothetical protein [Phycisphaerae bacterium]NIU10799.1 hypothetical protein [Phycisphaerae bacterium]NIU58594.1 hypothetical protein [Phycisphaerae bacterium]
MAKRLSKASIIVLVCFVSAIAISADKANSGGKEMVAERAKSQKSASLAVEAYLVQIPARALREAGVSIIPSKPEEAISIPKLLSCMTAGKDKGVLISSTRLVVGDNEEATSTIQNTYNLRLPATTKAKKGSEESYRIHQYKTVTEITVTTHIGHDDLIDMTLSFSHNGLTFDTADRIKEGLPPDLVEYQLAEIFEIREGRAVIVGSAQNGDTGLFLVVRAEILK